MRYRGKPPKEEHIGPTFEEFVRYVTETHGRVDEHWAPIYDFCTPCSINFTVIAKVWDLFLDILLLVFGKLIENLVMFDIKKLHTLVGDILTTISQLQEKNFAFSCLYPNLNVSDGNISSGSAIHHRASRYIPSSDPGKDASSEPRKSWPADQWPGV